MLYLSSLGVMTAVYLFIPTLPVYINSLLKNAGLVGVVMGLGPVVSIVLRLLITRLKSVSIKRFQYIGVGTIIVATALYPLCRSFSDFAMVRMLFGAGLALFFLFTYLLLSITMPEKKQGWFFATYSTLFAVPAIFAAPLATWLYQNGGFRPVVFAALAAEVGTLAVLVMLEEKEIPVTSVLSREYLVTPRAPIVLAWQGARMENTELVFDRRATQPDEMQRRPNVKIFAGQNTRFRFDFKFAFLTSPRKELLLLWFFIIIADSGIITFLPLFAKARNLFNYGYFFAVYGISTIVFRLGLGWLFDRYPRKHVITLGAIFLVLAPMLLIFAKQMSTVLCAALSYGFGFALVDSIMFPYLMEGVPQEHRGLVIAGYGIGFDAAYLVGPIALGWWLYGFGFTALWTLVAGVSLGGLLMFTRGFTSRPVSQQTAATHGN